MKKNTSLWLSILLVMVFAMPAFGADRRIQYNQQMVGANHPSKSDTLNPNNAYIDIYEKGAKCDGTTDDTTAIQNALDAGVGRVFIPDGTCLFTSLHMSSSVTIYGPGKLKLKNATLGSAGITNVFYSTTAGVTVIIDGVEINGNKGNQTGNPRAYFADIDELRIINSRIHDFYTLRADRVLYVNAQNNDLYNNDYYGIVGYGCFRFKVTGGRAYSNGFAGAAVVGGGLSSRSGIYTTITTNNLTLGAASGTGVTATAASAVFESGDVGSYIFSGSQDGYAKIVGYTSSTVVTVDIKDAFSSTTVTSWTLTIPAFNTDIQGLHAYSNTELGINIDLFAFDTKVNGNYAYMNGIGTPTNGQGIFVQTDTYNTTLSDNHMYLNYSQGMKVSGSAKGTETLIKGNQSYLNGSYGFYLSSVIDFIFDGNQANDNTDDGIRLTGTYRGVVSNNWSGNRHGGAQPYGINQTTGDNISFVGNYMFGNATSDTIQTGTSTTFLMLGNRENDSTALGALTIIDTNLYRAAANVLKSDDKIVSGAGLGTAGMVSNTNTPSGATIKALPIYDGGGALVGYIPVYAATW